MDLISSKLYQLKSHSDALVASLGPKNHEYLMYIGLFFLATKILLPLVFMICNFLLFLFQIPPPKIIVDESYEEATDVLNKKYKKFNYDMLKGETKTIHYWDPSTMNYFGSTKAHNEKDVDEIVARSRVAQEDWVKTSFSTRRQLMRTFQRFLCENQETCARVAVRDSGKTMLCATIGEILVSCEKLAWLCHSGEQVLQPEYRDTGRMMMMKDVKVEYVPLGVIGAIVPWNYPLHNLMNPISAALFSGNSIVIKVSEYASWSIQYYKRMINACLDAVGAPRDLVQFVVGYGPTGAALVASDIDKLIFVGSPEIGAIVARAASTNLLPVVLELGGKDPFVVAEDCAIEPLIQTACRGIFQSMGQNCVCPERFFVYESIYDRFVEQIVAVVSQMRAGASLGDSFVDCGAICMGTNQIAKYQALVDDAVSKGARVMVGGYIPKTGPLAEGSFYPPTVLVDVPESADVAQSEVFGPLMVIFKVKGDSDAEAIRMANNCDFALSSSAFSGDETRARKIASQLRAGMCAVNDLGGCTYMSQTLPFGGLKKSGYDRFAGPEGLRGLCSIKSVCEDKFSFIRNAIPPPMHYPATGVGHRFAQGLINMFYNTSLIGNLGGLLNVIYYAMPGAGKKEKSE